ncbi:hypothetical protein A2U01_0077501, partial [Trifolium medium]|nr:hypothetical protein [Trifolium medium]
MVSSPPPWLSESANRRIE